MCFFQIRWEEDIILDPDEARDAVVKELRSGKQPMCGWIPTQHTRTYGQFMAMLKDGSLADVFEHPDKEVAVPPPYEPGGIL